MPAVRVVWLVKLFAAIVNFFFSRENISLLLIWGSSRLLASMFTVASRFRRLNFVGSYLSTIEAVGAGSWLSVVQVLLDVSIALLVAITEFHGGIQRGYRTISSGFFFVKRYTQTHLKITDERPLFSGISSVQPHNVQL